MSVHSETNKKHPLIYRFVTGVWHHVLPVYGRHTCERMSNLPTGGKATSEHNPSRCSVFHLKHTASAAAVGPSPWLRGYSSPDARRPLP